MSVSTSPHFFKKIFLNIMLKRIGTSSRFNVYLHYYHQQDRNLKMCKTMIVIVYHECLARLIITNSLTQILTFCLTISKTSFTYIVMLEDLILIFWGDLKIQLCKNSYIQLYGYYIAIVCTPFLLGAWQDLNFQRGLLGKRVVIFSGGCNFYIQNKLKSEIFNDKKVYKQNYFFLSQLRI